ncbi:MAG TPA: M28 family peptidase, partial [Thermoanaerobaculia bacterium]|nr:M28 family peptidase [Thermoanaerobaculia bacterium]
IYMRSLFRITAAVAIFIAIGVALVRQPVLRGVAYGDNPRASAALLRRHVNALTHDFAPRGARNIANLDRAADYLARSFRASGARVSIQEYDARGRRYRNVLARFGPASGKLLVVGAHYDAFCETGDLPGADDNASGTAALLEIARLLSARPPKQPVLLAAWSTEEPPFFGSEQMGSAVHAESLVHENVEGLICLEMIGYYAPRQAWPNWLFALLYPSRGDFIAVGGGWDDRALVRRVKRGIRGAGGIRVYSFTGPRVTLDASDQRNFWSRGWPAALVTDTAFLRNPNYHTARDTAETLDYEKMARVVDGVFNAVR